MEKIPISVIIPVKNEEKNLPKCLSLLDDFSEVIVVDSQSTDKTAIIVKEYGYQLINFIWNGRFPKKRNWVLRNIPLKNEWVLFLDADEYVTDDFKSCVRKKIQNEKYTGFWIYYDDHFMGGRLKYGVKMRKLSLFKKEVGEYERIEEDAWSHLDMEIHEHPIITGNIGVLPIPIIHLDYNGFEHYITKHNAYSTWEAKRYFKLKKENSKLTFRQKVKYTLLASWILGPIYFLYSYFFRLGFLDGRSGFIFALLKMQYFFHIKCKIEEFR